ncbi:uncharacterized protein LOC133719900 [Rosa rugosa]|uniref:uncharacterized protein LOC133708054 n=2 Tax=Rosa rugosa TaxID=74645 RepID=UPI002B407116|nr:uncharacterized protein LOC133708054 [Rosa rugosa]XP_061989485.1 uncharacterized protein LOC133708054 [Rosa rugosa]XP_062002074.1 uncharacterized protein LOC133719900 [Rosa rugosa]XP_062002075.1 uncharacterized protein LOC133719900 [Rosa rugosa]
MSYFIDSGGDHEENTGYDDENIGYDDSETQDIGGMFQQQAMSPNNDNGLSETPTITKRQRGPNQKNWALEGPEKLLWNRFGLPKGPRKKVARFSRYLGILAKDCSLFPISEPDFRKFNKSDNYERAWNRVKETLDLTHPRVACLESKIREKVRSKLNERWKHWKSELSQKWYKPFKNSPLRFRKPDDDRVDEDQWKVFVANNDKKKHQRMVTINKRNRSQKRMNQSTGTRTYASVAHEYELLHGKEPDRWELFKLTHRKAGTQEPIDAASAKAIADFEEAEQKRLSMNVDITAPEIREEMYAEVLGKEKGNRVRGLGAGVTWDEVPGIHVEERGVSKEVQLLRERLEAQTKEAQEREARLMDELQRKMAEQTKKMEEMFEVRCVGMAVQKMGELFKQCGISVDSQEDMEQTMSQFAQTISQRPSNVIFSPNDDVYRPTLPFECSDMQTD